MAEKFKSFLNNDQLFYGAVVIIVAICSFGLGQLSATSEKNLPATVKLVEPIIIDRNIATNEDSTKITTKTSQPTLTSTKTSLVGSKNGTKYHLLTCPGAKQIKPENLVTFNSISQAEASGYSPAGNCPGL